MSSTLTTTTGYGFAVPNEAIHAWEWLTSEEFEIEEFLKDYPDLAYAMAYFNDYWPEDRPVYAVFIKGSTVSNFGVGVFDLNEIQNRPAPEDVRRRGQIQLIEAADALGLPGTGFAWHAVVSYG